MIISQNQARQQEIRKKIDKAQKDLIEEHKKVDPEVVETNYLLHKDIDTVKSGRTFTA